MGKIVFAKYPRHVSEQIGNSSPATLTCPFKITILIFEKDEYPQTNIQILERTETKYHIAFKNLLTNNNCEHTMYMYNNLVVHNQL